DLALAVAGLVRVSLNPRLAPPDWDGIRQDCRAGAVILDDRIDGASAWLRDVSRPFSLVVVTARSHPNAHITIDEIISTAEDSAILPIPDPQSVCALHYSSGTTGAPKGAQRTHANRLASAEAMRRHVLEPTLDPVAGNAPVFLHAGPLVHTSGLFVLPMLQLGARQVLIDHPRPADIVSAVAAHEVSHTVLIP
ncbi:AMP-binding protein, partial [Mycobacterium sp.]|uniref:AMP-binding protein n=1 Tax=Mycobacterium sp. TaxID=1785 RepID=UPI00127A935A